MNLTRIAILGVALIAGTAAAVLIYGALGSGTPPSEASLPAPPPVVTAEVLVAAKDVEPGLALTADMVRWESWPNAAVSSALITKEEQPELDKAIAGMVARAPLVAGQPLTPASVVTATASGFLAATLKSGMRGVGVPVSAETTAGGFILPNDRVDVVLTRDTTGSNTIKSFESRTILRDVRVLAVDQTVKQADDVQSVVAKTATLELTPPQAELISRAGNEGILSLVLRALGDSAGQPVTEIAVARADPLPRANSGGRTITVFRYGIRQDAAAAAAAAPAPAPAPAENVSAPPMEQ